RRLAQGRQGGVAVALLELGADAKRTERLDLIRRRAVEDAVGPPKDIVLADVAQQLPEHMRRLLRVAHDRPPRRSQLGVDVLVRTDTLLVHRRDEAVDSAMRRGRRERPLAPGPLEARVVDDDANVRTL